MPIQEDDQVFTELLRKAMTVIPLNSKVTGSLTQAISSLSVHCVLTQCHSRVLRKYLQPQLKTDLEIIDLIDITDQNSNSSSQCILISSTIMAVKCP